VTAGLKGQDGENCIMWSFTCCDFVGGRWPVYCSCTFMYLWSTSPAGSSWYITLHCNTLHYTAIHYTTLRCNELHSTTVEYYMTLHCTAKHCPALHYIVVHYITLHCTAIH